MQCNMLYSHTPYHTKLTIWYRRWARRWQTSGTHRWHRNPRPQPGVSSKHLVILVNLWCLYRVLTDGVGIPDPNLASLATWCCGGCGCAARRWSLGGLLSLLLVLKGVYIDYFDRYYDYDYYYDYHYYYNYGISTTGILVSWRLWQSSASLALF